MDIQNARAEFYTTNKLYRVFSFRDVPARPRQQPTPPHRTMCGIDRESMLLTGIAVEWNGEHRRW